MSHAAQLVNNEDEAAVVWRIFEEMLTIGSPTQISAQLTRDGITTKALTTQEGQTRSGARIDKKYLHKLLRNRIYLGELSLKGTWYPSAHPAIIDPGLWGRVHEVLSKSGALGASKALVRTSQRTGQGFGSTPHRSLARLAIYRTQWYDLTDRWSFPYPNTHPLEP